MESFLSNLAANTIGSMVQGAVSDHWNQKAEERNYKRQQEYSRQMAELQYQNESKMLHESSDLQDQKYRALLKDQYKMAVESLQAANINPMYAAGHTTSVSGVPGETGGMSAGSSLGNSSFSPSVATQSALMQASQQELISSQADYYDALTRKAGGPESSVLQAQASELLSRVGLNESSTKRTEAETQNLRAMTKYISPKMQAEISELTSRGSLNDINFDKIEKEIQALEGGSVLQRAGTEGSVLDKGLSYLKEYAPTLASAVATVMGAVYLRKGPKALKFLYDKIKDLNNKKVSVQKFELLFKQFQKHVENSGRHVY